MYADVAMLYTWLKYKAKLSRCTTRLDSNLKLCNIMYIEANIKAMDQMHAADTAVCCFLHCSSGILIEVNLANATTYGLTIC